VSPGLPRALGEHGVFYVLKKILIVDTLLLLWTPPPSSQCTNIQNIFFLSMIANVCAFFFHDCLMHQIISVDRIFSEVKAIQFIEFLLLLGYNCLKA